MATDDTKSDSAESSEGIYIGEQLQRLASSMGIPNARQFALRFGIPYKHLNNLWNNTRHAGLPTIAKIAQRTGRAVAYFFGDETARPQLGVMDSLGRIDMSTRQPVQGGFISLPEACGPFAAGSRLILEPSPMRADVWLLVRTIATGDEWLAWSRDHAGLPILARPTGESVIYSATAHEIVGAIVNVVTPPPPGPSA